MVEIFSADITFMAAAVSFNHGNIGSGDTHSDTHSDTWLIDSGATRHMAIDRSHFINYRSIINSKHKVQVGNRQFVQASGVGDIKLVLDTGFIAILKDVLHVPSVKT